MTKQRKRILEARLTVRVRQFFVGDDPHGEASTNAYGFAALLMPNGGDWVRIYGPYPTKQEARSKAHVVALSERAVVVE